MGMFETFEETQKTFADQELALRARDAMKVFAEQQVGTPQPLGRLARVVKVSNKDHKAQVWFPGDDEPVEVHLLSHLIPINADVNSAVTQSTSTRGAGARVWVEQLNGKPYVTAVLSGGVMTNFSSQLQSRGYALNPAFGTSGQSFAVQTQGEFSLVVPMPDTGDAVGFGPFDGPIGGAYQEITIHDMMFGVNKTYQFGGLAEFAAGFTPDAWYKLVPRYTNVGLDFFSDQGDFDLEIGNAPFVSLWDASTHHMMSLRIRRKNDTETGIFGQADGYRIIIKSQFGAMAREESLGFFPFVTWIDTTSSEPAFNYGANNYNTGLGLPCTGPYDAPGIDFPRRAQLNLWGPSGYVAWDGTNFKFTGSFLVSGGGMHPHTLQAGQANIDMPPNGTTVVVVGSATSTSQSVGVNGIVIAEGQALYYNMKIGGDIFTDNSRWVIVDKTKIAQVPAHWLLIAHYPLTGGHLRLGNGELVDSGEVTIGAAAGWATTSGYLTVRRVGKQVMANWDLIRTGGNLAANISAAMFTVPALYLPPNTNTTSFEVGANMSTGTAGRAWLSTAGVVTLQNHAGINTNQRTGGSAVWFTP